MSTEGNKLEKGEKRERGGWKDVYAEDTNIWEGGRGGERVCTEEGGKKGGRENVNILVRKKVMAGVCMCGCV